MNIEKQEDIKQAHGMQDSAIRKIGVVVDENLYTLDLSTDNLVVIYLGFGSLLRKDCCSSLNKLCVTQV